MEISKENVTSLGYFTKIIRQKATFSKWTTPQVVYRQKRGKREIKKNNDKTKKEEVKTKLVNSGRILVLVFC